MIVCVGIQRIKLPSFTVNNKTSFYYYLIAYSPYSFLEMLFWIRKSVLRWSLGVSFSWWICPQPSEMVRASTARFCSRRTAMVWGMVLLKPQHSHAVVTHSGPKTSIVPKLPLLSVVLLTSYHNQNAFVRCCLVKEGCFHVGEILQI